METRKLLKKDDRQQRRLAEHIGEVLFLSCPACYAPLEKDSPPHACPLCKTPFDSEQAKDRIVALINDAAIQLKQSRVLQERRESETGSLDDKLKILLEDWSHASRRLAQLQKLPSSELRDKLRALHRKAGYLERQIEDLEQKASLVQLIDQLSSRKNELNHSINRLRDDNEKLRLSQLKRLSRAYTLIADEIRTLLRHDLRRQDSFESAEKIEFDFASNRISVDGQNYFSASSRVILKSSFFLGFLAAALKEPFFRHPRFCMIDTIEDKGMEPIRSHNFQLQVARISDATQIEHQVIFATSMIAPDLDDERYTIGKFSTRDDRTINIQS